MSSQFRRSFGFLARLRVWTSAKLPRVLRPCGFSFNSPRASCSAARGRPPSRRSRCPRPARARAVNCPWESRPRNARSRGDDPSVCTARRLSAGLSEGPFGTAQETSTPSISSRKSSAAAWHRAAGRRSCSRALSRTGAGGGSGVSSNLRLPRYWSRCHQPRRSASWCGAR